jgi:SAM-dependent methyltransferase
MNALQVSEQATDESLCPEGYLAANPDLQRAFGSDHAAAREHFQQYGRAERRRQFTRVFLDQREEFRRQKLDLFRPSLLDAEIETLPAFVGNSFADLTQYDAEPANATPGFFEFELATNPGKLYADVGAGLRDKVYVNCIYLEIYPSVTADIVTEPTCILPFVSASLDGIGCFAVLEHVKTPWILAEEFARVIKPGGKIFIDWPFLQGVHGYPSHYYNATREGLRELFAPHFDAAELYTGQWQGPDYTVHSILQSLLRSIKDRQSADKLSGMTVGELANVQPESPMWKHVIGHMDNAAISMLSCGNTLIARRKQD